MPSPSVKVRRRAVSWISWIPLAGAFNRIMGNEGPSINGSHRRPDPEIGCDEGGTLEHYYAVEYLDMLRSWTERHGIALALQPSSPYPSDFSGQARYPVPLTRHNPLLKTGALHTPELSPKENEFPGIAWSYDGGAKPALFGTRQCEVSIEKATRQDPHGPSPAPGRATEIRIDFSGKIKKT
ncbi:hypothetical protein NLG97_g3433 [Lecanicillium saksenae]|uniref:Uncharacterized protein n=1 Tax=Lecanicillium saksenae TaxID=468837 RepID=A0ACC1R0T2_9HYPO|nr:hypothetical protein NLG97_g3433 [Lecanicillium saksenae]